MGTRDWFRGDPVDRARDTADAEASKIRIAGRTQGPPTSRPPKRRPPEGENGG